MPRADNVSLCPLLVKPEVKPDGDGIRTTRQLHWYHSRRRRRIFWRCGRQGRHEVRPVPQEIDLEHSRRRGQKPMIQTAKVLEKESSKRSSDACQMLRF